MSKIKYWETSNFMLIPSHGQGMEHEGLRGICIVAGLAGIKTEGFMSDISMENPKQRKANEGMRKKSVQLR